MAAKVYFFKDSAKGWIYGQFKDDGITPKSEITVPPCRKRWQVIDGIEKVEFLYEQNHGSFLQPYLISEIASDLIGTAWTSRAAFDTATLSFFLDSGVSSDPNYIDSYFTLTRPANVTPYSDGDAILDVVGIATQKFAGVAKLAGRGVNFINLLAFTNDTGLAGKTIKVVFYTASPASPIADNAAFSYGTANAIIRKGTVDLTFGTGINAGTAQLGIDSNGMLNLALCPTGVDVYVQVWLPVGYTPSANSTTILFKASLIQN